MKANIQKIQRLMTICFVLVALSLLYWQLLVADPLLARDENPRLVIAEQQIQRGKIVTSHGVTLAETYFDSAGLAQRNYTIPSLAPVTGYYSVRYGTGGLEAEYNPQLRGDTQPRSWLTQLLHQAPIGEHITITLHLPAQLAANEMLNRHQDAGAIVAMDAASGQVLVLASQPTFDPNTLDESWDDLIEDPNAPLLNRATQGLFSLGEAARLITLVGLAETRPASFETRAVLPLVEMTREIGEPKLVEVIQQLGLDQEIDFSLPSTAAPIPSDLSNKAGEITVTPLHMALLAAAVTQSGNPPMPTLLPEGAASVARGRPLLTAESAKQVAPYFSDFSGFAAPDVTGNEPLSWYITVTDSEPPLVLVAVVATPDSNREAARQIAQPVLQALP